MKHNVSSSEKSRSNRLAAGCGLLREIATVMGASATRVTSGMRTVSRSTFGKASSFQLPLSTIYALTSLASTLNTFKRSLTSRISQKDCRASNLSDVSRNSKQPSGNSEETHEA